MHMPTDPALVVILASPHLTYTRDEHQIVTGGVETTRWLFLGGKEGDKGMNERRTRREELMSVTLPVCECEGRGAVSAPKGNGKRKQIEGCGEAERRNKKRGA